MPRSGSSSRGEHIALFESKDNPIEIEDDEVFPLKVKAPTCPALATAPLEDVPRLEEIWSGHPRLLAQALRAQSQFTRERLLLPFVRRRHAFDDER